MLGSFKVKEKYIYRHRMLEYLYQKIKDEPIDNIDLNKTKTLFSQMADDLKIEPKKLQEYHQGFHGFENDHVLCPKNLSSYIYITEAGIQAYVDDFWLREGEKELNERMYDKTKWIIPVFALIITAASFIYTMITTNKSKSEISILREQTVQLRNEIERVSRSLPPSGR